MVRTSRIWWVGVVLFGLVLSGCIGEKSLDLTPPEAWTHNGDRWWRAEADTSIVFRNLDGLKEMGVFRDDIVYVSNLSLSNNSALVRKQVERAVKQKLIRLFRTEPEIVDSLFSAYVLPRLSKITASHDVDAEVERYKTQGYKLIRTHFREPLPALELNKDIMLPSYPDSLRGREIGGTVIMQVYINAEGEPQSIELIEGIHPVFDAIAMRATTEMRWSPAYLRSRMGFNGVPSWARFRITFPPS